jgi:CheY-like chemotaxis protein
MACLAEDGASALRELQLAHEQGDPFALVLTDAHMPGMDGYALAKRVKRDPRFADVSVVMLSSAGEPGDAMRCRQLQLEACLTKPVQQAQLQGTLQKVIGGRPRRGVVSIKELQVAPPRRAGAPIGLRILVAEDNQVNQLLVTRLLEKRHHQLTVVGNGFEVLDALERQRDRGFDLILMDVQMPEMNGFEATRIIREGQRRQGRHIPIIAMTAHAMKGDRERCVTAGMDGYVSKPIQAQELYAAIDAVVGQTNKAKRGMVSEGEDSYVLDKATALANLGGDEHVLAEVAHLFLVECSRLMSEVREAIRRNNALALERAAHTIKGSVRTFAAQKAYETARRLEELGREGKLKDAEGVYENLEAEIDRLKHDMKSLMNDRTAPNAMIVADVGHS